MINDSIFAGTRKYSMAIYLACIESFNALPVAAVLDRRFFCVHGGISPELNSLADIDKVRYALHIFVLLC